MGKIIKKIGKKGQLTVFIILALAIAVILILLFTGRSNLTAIFTPSTPLGNIKECVQEPFQKALDIVSLQGGSLNPEHYYTYDGGKVEYLCYAEEDYELCVMQKPLLKQSIERELNAYITPKVKECIEDVKSSLKSKGYSVSSKDPGVSVSLIPNAILIDIQPELRFSKDKTESYDSIKIDLNSELYQLVMISSSITNWEARYGASESLLYMSYYPTLRVEKKKQSDGTTVYTLTDRTSLDKFRFATRSFVLAPGIEQ
tara:strand:+ start:4995 stop:5768 length:774 start_codon:yes stop_codon:yes gene_type:complete